MNTARAKRRTRTDIKGHRKVTIATYNKYPGNKTNKQIIRKVNHYHLKKDNRWH